MKILRQSIHPILPMGFAVALSLLGDLSLFATLTTQLDVLGLTLAQAGILLSIHRLVRIPGNPLVGVWMDRLGRRPLFLAGLVLAVLSTASYSFAQGFWLFLLARVGWGMAWSLINVGGLNMVLDLATPATRGRLSGQYSAWVWTGYALAPLLGGFLVDSAGFRPAMQILSLVTAVGLGAALLLLPETFPPERRTAGSGGFGERLAALWNGGRELVARVPRIRKGMILLALVLFAGDGIVLSSLTLLISTRLGQVVALPGAVLVGVASFSGGLLAARSILAGACGSVAGRLSDGRFSREHVIAAGLGLGALSFSLLAFGSTLGWILLGIVVGAVAGGTLPTVLAAYVGDAAPPGQQGITLGAYATAGDAGSMVGPFMALALVPLVGLAPVYFLASLVFLAGMALILKKDN